MEKNILRRGLMREIKFKAWDEQNKIMHFDFQFIKSGETGNDWILFNSDKEKNIENQNPYFSQQLKIMQYTGLKDCKRTEEFPEGQEIYEGDIDSRKHIVKYYSGSFIMTKYESAGTIISFYMNKFGIEIIGNIYENPELLEKINE
jgi:hypothetical protein